MFAIMCPQAHIIRRSRHHWRSQHHLPKANIIQKEKHTFRCAFFLAEKERFELSRRYTRPTPLAGAPLRPLEYFSIFTGSVADAGRLRCIRPIIISKSPSLVKSFGRFFAGFLPFPAAGGAAGGFFCIFRHFLSHILDRMCKKHLTTAPKKSTIL